MLIQEYDHRNAKDILEAKGVVNFLESKIKAMQELCAEDPLHSVIMNNIRTNQDWQKKFIVPESKPSQISKMLFYDLYNIKAKVALEIEFTRSDRLFRDFMKLTRGYNAGVVDAGVIVTLFSDSDVEKLTKSTGVAPTLKMCSEYLNYFYSEISVPLWMVGLCSEKTMDSSESELNGNFNI